MTRHPPVPSCRDAADRFSVSGTRPKSVHGVSRAYQYGVCAEPTFHLTRSIGRGVTRTPIGARSVRLKIFSIAGNSSSRARADAELPPVLGVGSHLFQCGGQGSCGSLHSARRGRVLCFVRPRHNPIHYVTKCLPAHPVSPSSVANERSDGERVWTTQKEGNRSP